MDRYPRAVNLLDGHPEGLGKSIEVYQLNPPGYTIDGYFFKENITNDRLPFMVSYDSKVYLIILGSEIVREVPKEFDVLWASDTVMIRLREYVLSIWHYLNFEPSDIKYQLIGWQQ
jgi:hypothetical protein